MLGRKEEAPWQLHTCEHAFIHHTASINQNSITWQWQFSWKNEDVSRNQKTRLQLLQTYTTARFPWLAELFLFLFKNETGNSYQPVGKNYPACSPVPAPFHWITDSQEPGSDHWFLGHGKGLAEPTEDTLGHWSTEDFPFAVAFSLWLGSRHLVAYSVLGLGPAVNPPDTWGAAPHPSQRAMTTSHPPRLSQNKYWVSSQPFTSLFQA